ncbi:hypothetical protein JFV29_16750 [Peribacillus sp. TH16]|uniref:hypothetical protein n=1 Tax=Peribacillus sp. TH16 TaxID=2798482 RepID=UPI0019136EB4|nr:hypothetical protein [Peribacillus sp. TH16]MBK5483497.1 hypothetical protein [Peribacillus sp. TH16]
MKNFSFFENNNTGNLSRKFYSINFYTPENDVGEIHYSNSFEYGNMNVINFIRRSNLFFLFTSSVQHSKFFKKTLKLLLDEEVTFEILKIPIKENLIQTNTGNNLNIIEADEIYGIVGMLKFNDVSNLIKIYNNGLITFPFTNNMDLIKEVINSFLELIKND